MHQKLSAGLIVILFILQSAFPDALMVGLSLISAIMLYGFLSFIERQKSDKTADLEKKIKELSEEFKDFRLRQGLKR